MRPIALAVVALLAVPAAAVRAGDPAQTGSAPASSEKPAAAPAPAAKAEEAPAFLDEPPALAFVAARGWDRVEFSNETDAAVRVRAYQRLPKTGKWRQFRFPKDVRARPRFYKPNAPAGPLEFTLPAGDRVGWRRYGRAEMAFQIVDPAGEDLSANFRFRAERPTVAITKPDAWMRGERAPSGSGDTGLPSAEGQPPASGSQPKDASAPADGRSN